MSFVRRLRDLLLQLLVSPRGIPSPLKDRFAASFSDLENRQAFESIVQAIESREYDEQLADHGLVGEQLRVKMTLFEIAVREYEEARRSGLARFTPWREAEAGRRALDIGDKILGSITAATPVPGAGAAFELKQAFEWALGLWKRWRRLRSWPEEWEDIQPF